jgi:sulfotransferase
MQTMHAVAGLPRAGSTLFCNILNQHPDYYATSTSALPAFVRAIGDVASNRIEIKNLLDKYPEETQARLRRVALSICNAWHGSHGRRVVFDKSRGWTMQARTFREINPSGVIICLVRDLRAVFASIEKQNAKSGLLKDTSPILYDRYQFQFSDEGVIGGPFRAIVDLIDTKPGNVFFVRYEDLTREPAETMQRIYSALMLDDFEHDFEDVKNTAIDPDGFYLHKFPHQGSGKVEHRESDWPQWVPEHIAADIMKTAARYNEYFKYA